MTLLSDKSKARTSPEERHRQLIKASNDYMAGKISHSEFRETELRCMTDYNAVTLELGSFRRAIRTVFNRFVAIH